MLCIYVRTRVCVHYQDKSHRTAQSAQLAWARVAHSITSACFISRHIPHEVDTMFLYRFVEFAHGPVGAQQLPALVFVTEI